MKKILALASGACLLTLLPHLAFADADYEEEGTVTGDEFAPEQVDQDPAKLSHADAAARVRAVGINIVSSGGCTTRTKSNCTSLDQINSATIDGVITLRRASGCAITITGGTETGHASGTYSHWTGYKVDVAITACVTSYVRKNFAYQGLRGDGAPLYKSAAGNLYANEGNHWDITYF